MLTDDQGQFQVSVVGAIHNVRVTHEDFQPVTVKAPFKKPLVVSLRSWPIFKGLVKVGAAAPMNTTVRLYTKGQAKSIRINKDGRWAHPLKPGRYFMTARSRVVGDDAGEMVTPNEMIPVLLHQGPLEFDEATEPLKLKISEVMDVHVRAGAKREGIPKPYAAMLLNDTGRILLSAPFRDGVAEFKTVAGDYMVVVIFADRSAQALNLKVEEGEQADIEFDGRKRGRPHIKDGRLLIEHP